MIKGWMHEITLAVQARTGVTAGLFVGLGIALLAALTAFIFLCVAGYDWLALQFGSVFAALIMTGFFLLIAVIATVIAMAARSHARQRAILERAAHSHGGSWLLDPKIMSAAVSALSSRRNLRLRWRPWRQSSLTVPCAPASRVRKWRATRVTAPRRCTACASERTRTGA